MRSFIVTAPWQTWERPRVAVKLTPMRYVSGQVVGYGSTYEGADHAFLYSDGHMSVLVATISESMTWWLPGSMQAGKSWDGRAPIGSPGDAFLYNNGTMMALVRSMEP